jgi:hypothetical protein
VAADWIVIPCKEVKGQLFWGEIGRNLGFKAFCFRNIKSKYDLTWD